MKRTYSRNRKIGAWRQGVPGICFVCCGKGDWRGLQVHHIQRKSGGMPKARRDRPENLFLCCAPCHEGPLATMPHAQQLALKWVHDKCNHPHLPSFVLAWLLIYDPGLVAPERVTPAEVEAFLPILDPRRAHLPPLPR